MGRPSRPPYTIEPALAEAIVLDAWLQREIVGRRGVNLVTALAHPSERLALESLASALASLADIDNVRAWIGWARSLLDPPDTEIRIDAQGGICNGERRHARGGYPGPVRIPVSGD